MTGKTQKAKANTEEFLKAVAITEEEKTKILDEAIIEVFGKNKDFIEGIGKMSIKAFRGFYIMHTFYSMVDKLADEKVQKLLNDKVTEYQKKEELKHRK